MKYSPLFFLATGCCAAACLVPLTANAEFILPEEIVFISNGEDSADALIDDFDLFDEPPTPQSIHDPAGGNWSAVGSIKADIVFDLGERISLTKAYIWNFNANGSTDAGMKAIEIAVAGATDVETAHFTTVAAATLEEGGEEAQIVEFAATDTRLVRIRSLSNHGNGFTIGLAEVRFERGEVEGNVPSILVQSPREGEVIPLGSPIEISFTPTKEEDNIVKAEFFDGDTLLNSNEQGGHSFTLEGAELGEHVLKVVATEASGHVVWSTVTVAVRDAVGRKISQVDDAEDEGDGLGQIAYTGAWNLAQGNENDPRFKNNDHWSNEADAFFEVRFSGAKIDVYATVASHHGSAIATIDDGAEFDVSYTAEQRGEQVLVWSSPVLPDGEHVLRITNVGDGVVTADRFDVHEADPLGPLEFQIVEVLYKKGGNPSVDITWGSRDGQTFTVESTRDFVQFTELTDAFESQGDRTTFIDDASPAGMNYYRVRVE
jgi:hypothetical protein